MKSRILKLSILILLLTILSAAQDVASFEKRITVKQLDNGLTILICERPEAPVFSFFTIVDAGSAQDQFAIYHVGTQPGKPRTASGGVSIVLAGVRRTAFRARPGAADAVGLSSPVR